MGIPLEQIAGNIANRVANQYGLDPAYFRQVFSAQINQESGFNPNAKSAAGAEGVAQIMPQYHPGVNPYNPKQALQFAANWDAQNVRKYGNWANALSVYNSGKPWSIGQSIGETNNYVKSILGKAGGQQVDAAWGTPGQPRPQGGKPPAGLWKNSSQLSEVTSLLNGVLSSNHAGFTLPAIPTSGSSLRIGGQNGITVSGIDHASSRDVAAVSAIRGYLGTPYVWGGESPKGFDCSGLLQYVWGQQGVQIPRTSQEQWQHGQGVNSSQLRPGDAVFFVGSDGTKSAPGHVGMYIGNGKYVEAPHTGDVVKIAKLADAKDYVGARRYG
jgi:cell wall-associated NlpC family hydrolase